MKHWEYMTAELNPSDPLPALQKMGQEGWELAGITADSEAVGLAPREVLIAFMKRETGTQ